MAVEAVETVLLVRSKQRSAHLDGEDEKGTNENRQGVAVLLQGLGVFGGPRLQFNPGGGARADGFTQLDRLV